MLFVSHCGSEFGRLRRGVTRVEDFQIVGVEAWARVSDSGYVRLAVWSSTVLLRCRGRDLILERTNS